MRSVCQSEAHIWRCRVRWPSRCSITLIEPSLSPAAAANVASPAGKADVDEDIWIQQDRLERTLDDHSHASSAQTGQQVPVALHAAEDSPQKERPLMANRRSFACSFCGKDRTQGSRLIGGPDGVFICDGRVRLCNEIIRRSAAIIWMERSRQ